MEVPPAISDIVPAWFDDESAPIYGQAATVTQSGEPNIRTVHFRYIKEIDTIGFACHVESPKWRELRRQPWISGCHFSPRRRIQLRWRSKAELLDDPGAPARRILWAGTHEWIRREYWQDANRPLDEVCPAFGVVALHIDFWDVYNINLDDPSKSRRKSYSFQNGIWREESKSTLK